MLLGHRQAQQGQSSHHPTHISEIDPPNTGGRTITGLPTRDGVKLTPLGEVALFLCSA